MKTNAITNCSESKQAAIAVRVAICGQRFCSMQCRKCTWPTKRMAHISTIQHRADYSHSVSDGLNHRRIWANRSGYSGNPSVV